jgi:ATP-binding cassette subfamily B (MDR/TAP) protein 1
MQRPERAQLLLSVASALGLGAIAPVTGYLLTKLITVFFQPEPERVRSDALFWAAIMAAIALLQVCLEVARSWGLGVAGERLTRRLREGAFASMLRQEMAWHDAPANSAANLTANLSRDVTLVTAVTGEATGIQLANLATLSVGLTLIFWLGTWQLGLLALCVVPVIGVTIILQLRAQRGEGAGAAAAHKEEAGIAGDDAPSDERGKADQRKRAEASARKRAQSGAEARESASRIVGQLASSVRTVASFGLEESLYEAYARSTDSAAALQISRAYIPALLSGVAQFAILASMVSLYAYGAELISEGEASFESMFVGVCARAPLLNVPRALPTWPLSAYTLSAVSGQTQIDSKRVPSRRVDVSGRRL